MKAGLYYMNNKPYETYVPGQGIYFLSPDKIIFVPDDIAGLFSTDNDKLAHVAETLAEIYWKIQQARFVVGDERQVEDRLMAVQREIKECLSIIKQIGGDAELDDDDDESPGN